MDLSFFSGKKIFLTGHTGFKGSWLSRVLLNAGATLTGYALEAPEISLFSVLHFEKQMQSIIGDIRDLSSLENALREAKPDIVIHMAAQPLVRESYKDPVTTFETNIMGTVNLLDVLRRVEVRSVLNVTTDKVYENKEWCWGYRENEPLCGYDPYSNSKSCSELVTYSYGQSFFLNSGTALSTARSGNVIGGGDFSKDRIIPDCVAMAATKQPIIVRNPYSTRPYQHVLDCLSGYLLLVQKQWEDKKYLGSYNFGPDDASCVTTGALADLFCHFWGGEQNWINTSDGGPHEANFLKLDCSKSKAVLGWRPKWSIEDAVYESVEWYKNFIENKNIEKFTDEQINKYLQK